MACANPLRFLFEEKLERVFERHNVLASGVRAAVKAWGLHPCAKEPKWYSDTVTAIVVPPGFNGADVIDAAFRRYDLVAWRRSVTGRGQSVPDRPSRRSQ